LAFGRIKFGEQVTDDQKKRFYQKVLPYEAYLAVKQTDIGCITNPKFQYNLKVTN